MKRTLALVAMAALSLHSCTVAAAGSGTGFLVRVGQELRYYADCTVNTNILEPGDAGESHLVVSNCAMYDLVVTQAPTWIIDRQSSYGGVYFPDGALGQCWLIRQQLIANAGKSMTIECSETLLDSGFEVPAAD